MDLKNVIDQAASKYREIFKTQPIICSSAPGRVNLIGEHTDYNDGFVLPMALPLVTVIVGAKNNTNQCHIITVSDNIDDPKDVTFDIPSEGNLKPGKPIWANYIKGVMANFSGHLCGFNAVISSSVPVGGGLSSSAAVEVAAYTFLEALSDNPPNISFEEKAKLCQKAEQEFSGMPCGIMDQFISFLGKKDHALLLDCRSLEYTLVPLKSEDVSVLITNTNVRHHLSGSEYPLRRKQCEEAARTVGKASLRDVTLDELYAQKSKLSDAVFRRAKHVIKEIQRTMLAVLALQREDYAEFGMLMVESHASLKEDYVVSCPELDEVVSAALECDGVFGSRMTGGGFGGCTVTLLKRSAVPQVIKSIKEAYSGEPTFYVCQPSDGSRLVEIT